MRCFESCEKHSTFTPRSCYSLLAAAVAAVVLVGLVGPTSWFGWLSYPWHALGPALPCCCPNAVVAEIHSWSRFAVAYSHPQLHIPTGAMAHGGPLLAVIGACSYHSRQMKLKSQHESMKKIMKFKAQMAAAERNSNLTTFYFEKTWTLSALFLHYKSQSNQQTNRTKWHVQIKPISSKEKHKVHSKHGAYLFCSLLQRSIVVNDFLAATGSKLRLNQC